MEVLDGAGDAAGGDDRPRLAADLARPDHLVVEVVHHQLGLLPHGVPVPFHVGPELPLRLADVELGVVLHRLRQPVPALHWDVVGQHVQDEPLLDGLLHGVAVERPVPDHGAVGHRLAEELERLVLRRRGEREVAGVGQHAPRLEDAVDPVLGRLLLVGLRLRVWHTEGAVHARRRTPALPRVRLVDEDGEAAVPVLAADVVHHERELLDGGDDDLLPLRQEAAQVARPLGVPQDARHLGELPDRVPELLVEHPPVRDDDDGVEDRPPHPRGRAALLTTAPHPFEAHELVGEPRDGVGLPAPGRVLHEVAAPRAVRGRVGEQAAHHVALVVAWEDLPPGHASGPLLGLDDLRVVLQDVGQPLGGEHLAPEVVGLEAVRVGRVPGAVVPSLVEGQEPRVPAAEVRAHAHLLVVHGEVDEAAAELEEQLARVAVTTVLLDGVVDGLLGEAVLQLERGDREPVDEEAEVEGTRGVVGAVAELPGDAEDVAGVLLGGAGVARRGRAVEQVDVRGQVGHAAAEDVHHATLRDLALEPGEEPVAGRPGGGEPQPLDDGRLRGGQEAEQLREVEGVGAVVVRRGAGHPAAPRSGRVAGGRRLAESSTHAAGAPYRGARASEVGDDQVLEPALGGVSRHRSSPLRDRSTPLRPTIAPRRAMRTCPCSRSLPRRRTVSAPVRARPADQ